MSTSHAPGYVEDKHPPPHLHRGDALCLHDSATGREWTMPHVVEPGPRPRHEIVVMGAGPATPDRMSARTAVHRSSRVHGGKYP